MNTTRETLPRSARRVGPVLALVALLLGLGPGVAPAKGQDPGSDRDARSLLAGLPVHLVENNGRYPEAIRYVVHGEEKTIFLTDQGMRFLLHGRSASPGQGWAVDVKPVRRGRPAGPAVRAPVLEAGEPLPAVFSFFRGREAAWSVGCRSYRSVVYRSAWPGVDLVIRGGRRKLKYDLVVHPGADPKEVVFSVSGATGLSISDSGTLGIQTSAGVIEDERPTAYQVVGGRRVAVDVAFTLLPGGGEGDRRFGFRVGSHDPGHALVIDPAMIVYCGYIGGDSIDRGLALAAGPGGGVFFGGMTYSSSSSFPVRVGPYTTKPGWYDAFVGKLDGRGKLVYCGYLGGSKDDACEAVAVDAAGSAYVTGTTDSDEKSFPVKVGPGLVHKGRTDVFVAKVNAAGTGLIYCGYIGGANAESPSGIVLDVAGNAYIAGMVNSDETTFPVKVGPLLKFSKGSYNLDGFVAKVDRTGKALLYCGYVGGTAYDVCQGIAVDAQADVQ